MNSILRYLALIIVAAAVGTARAPSSAVRNESAAVSLEHPSNYQVNRVDVDAAIYAAIVDSLLVDSVASIGGIIRRVPVLEGVYWYPWIQKGRVIGARLGPAPGLLLAIGKRSVQTSTLSEVAVRRTWQHLASPVIVLGPIDWFSENSVLVRVGLYHPSLGTELFRAEMQRDGAVWRVTWIHLELRS
jgi:hypothetical protein